VRFLNSYATVTQLVEETTPADRPSCTVATWSSFSGAPAERSVVMRAAAAERGPLRFTRSQATYDPARPQPLLHRGIVRSAELYEAMSAQYPLPDTNGSLLERELHSYLTRVNKKHERGTHGSIASFSIWYDSYIMATFLKHSPAWATFDTYLHSRTFIADVLDAFGTQLLRPIDSVSGAGVPTYASPELRHANLLADPSRRKHVWHSEVETGDAELFRRQWHRLFNSTKVDPAELYTIWSFQAQRCGTRGKSAHRDRENRIFSLVIYFSDATTVPWTGGELLFCACRALNRSISESPTCSLCSGCWLAGPLPNQRPMYIESRVCADPGDTAESATLEPSQVAMTIHPDANLGVSFLNSARSIHRVADVAACAPTANLLGSRASDGWRRAVYISVARHVSSWDTVSRGPRLKNWPSPVPP
jgi:hypothetical protein